MKIRKLLPGLLTATIFGVMGVDAQAWDHPGHMTTAAIAFAEIERVRPDLIDKIGLLMLKHPDPAPFWVATVDGQGKERVRRMFIEAARWPDDTKWTIHDRPTWHSARWAIITDDAPPEARALAEARAGKPAGNAIEALVLNAAVLSNPESKPDERALALSWVLHIIGDIHQPLHVSDVFSKDFPTGNAAGTMAYVMDPLRDSAMPLHILWDSNTRRSTKLEDIDKYAQEIMAKYPRSSLPELKAYNGPDAFREWAWESHQVAVDESASLPRDRRMIKYILEGISPVEKAPKVPAEYWQKVQEVVPRRLALAGYRIADLLLAAADRIETERALAGQVLDALPRHGPTK